MLSVIFAHSERHLFRFPAWNLRLTMPAVWVEAYICWLAWGRASAVWSPSWRGASRRSRRRTGVGHHRGWKFEVGLNLPPRCLPLRFRKSCRNRLNLAHCHSYSFSCLRPCLPHLDEVSTCLNRYWSCPLNIFPLSRGLPLTGLGARNSVYSFPSLSRTFLDRATSFSASVQTDLNTFPNRLYDKKLLVAVSRAIHASITSQRDVNLFSTIMRLAIGAMAASAERTPLWAVCRTDSNHFLSSLSLTSGSISLTFNAGELFGQLR